MAVLNQVAGLVNYRAIFRRCAVVKVGIFRNAGGSDTGCCAGFAALAVNSFSENVGFGF